CTSFGCAGVVAARCGIPLLHIDHDAVLHPQVPPPMLAVRAAVEAAADRAPAVGTRTHDGEGRLVAERALWHWNGIHEGLQRGHVAANGEGHDFGRNEKIVEDFDLPAGRWAGLTICDL